MAALAAGAIGITAGIGQIVLMREEVALFNGNELSVGIVLATWLLWTAAGSAFPHWFSELRIPLRLSIAIGACASGASLGLTIWGLREMRVQLQEIPGQSLSPVAIAFTSLICLSVFCGLCGLQFSLAAKMYGLDCEVSDNLGTSYAYLYESAGFAAGALLTGIVLQPQLGSFQIAVVVCLLNICLAIWLMFPNMHARVGLMAGAITFAIILIARVAPGMELATEARLWKGFNITTIRESIYGRITILESGGVRSLFQNGVLLANAPDPASAEEVVHYALLEHPDPRKVMVIGGGTNGCLLEALKHPSLERIDYVELDPALIEVYRREFPTNWLNTFGDSRIHVHAADGRRFLNSSHETFDVVIVNVSDPENAQINRFYTTEFYETVRKHLSPQGVIALRLHASENAVSPALAEFLRSIYRTLSRVFPFIAVVPGSPVHMFGAIQAGVLTEEPQVLIRRLKSRQIQTQYLSEYSISFRMAKDRVSEIRAQLDSPSEVKINHDFLPIAYYFSTTLWSSQFSRTYARVLGIVNGLSFWKVVGSCFGALTLFSAGTLLSRSRTHSAAACSVLTTGFSLITVQILILFAFQSIFGYVYEEIAVITGMFMAGMASGSWMGTRYIRRAKFPGLMRAALAGQLAIAAAGPLMLSILEQMPGGASGAIGVPLSRLAIPVLAGLCGIPGGLQFSVACGIYKGARSGPRSTILYSFDLVGGCIGAFLVAGILIPVFGFWRTAWLAAALCLGAAVHLIVAAITTPNSSSLLDVPRTQPR